MSTVKEDIINEINEYDLEQFEELELQEILNKIKDINEVKDDIFYYKRKTINLDVSQSFVSAVNEVCNRYKDNIHHSFSNLELCPKCKNQYMQSFQIGSSNGITGYEVTCCCGYIHKRIDMDCPENDIDNENREEEK